MSDIKFAIRTLCTHLNFLLDTNVKAEHFRLAKFDKTDDDAVPALWETIKNFAIKLDSTQQQLRDCLMALKYHNEKFYSMSEDKLEGSRELLITLSFLVSKELDNLITTELEMSPFHDNFNILERTPADSGIVNNFTSGNLEHYTNWLKGKIELNKRTAEDYSEHNQKILKKISGDYPQMSLNVTLALSSEKYGRIFVDKSERILKILENHGSWLKKEAVFWQWMDTVLRERVNY